MTQVCIMWSHALGRIKFTTREDPIGAKQGGLDHGPLVRPQGPGAYTEH